MQEQSGKGLQQSPQKLKLAGSSARGTVLGPIGEAVERKPSLDVGPDPVKEEMRFCDWAFSRLGHVAVFRFSEGGFMLLAENGERTRGDSLARALLGMLEQQGLNDRRLVYPAAADDSRAA
ncbi:hypothetical protein ACT2FY_38270 [Paraburkholderia fungorum]|uniref:hypothetical protein n=1 Tax=Paraburkholderia fungorum TaxID=134537 RepID=UPI00402BF477